MGGGASGHDYPINLIADATVAPPADIRMPAWEGCQRFFGFSLLRGLARGALIAHMGNS